MKTFSFYKHRNMFFVISSLILLAGIIGFFIFGLELDIQFKGGTILKYTYVGTVDTDTVQAEVGKALGRSVTAQTTTDLAQGETRLIVNLSGNTGLSTEEMGLVEDTLAATFAGTTFEISSTNMVEPFFGQRFLRNGIYAIVLSFLLIMVYVWFRFRNIGGLSAGAMAVVALVHDAMTIVVVFILFGIPVGDTFVAVILTVLGYSINDTIVIYDRIRENKKLNPKQDVGELVDHSIRQSFTRSLCTSIAVFISVMVVYVFAFGYGIDSIKDFALPMAVGTVTGCYSSICIAGPLWVMWQKRGTSKKAA